MTHSTWTFEQDELSISVQRSKEGAVVIWRGVSDARNPGSFLNPMAERLLPLLKGARVTVDFRLLEYMNSATVAPLINFVKRLDANGSPVTVVFSDIDWQRVHMTCMKSIARTLTNVRVEGRSEPETVVVSAAGTKSR
jgi:anti-anti-sigma regulatory factor